MRTYLILIGMFAWIIWAVIWSLPLKRKLLKIHGHNKTNDYLLELAKQGDPDARRLRKRGYILILVGCFGSLVIAFTNYS